MPRPTVATIHLAAMRHNLARARACAPGAWLWAVVKANAYGHGLARALRGFGAADGMALIEIDQAVRLRELGWRKPILLLEGLFTPADVAVMRQYGLNGAVHCVEQIAMLEAAGLARSLAGGAAALDVHLKMNTGMNRLGFTPAAYAAAYARLRALPGIGSITLMTHFANADELEHPHLSMDEQIRRFQRGAAGLPGPRSLCNSAGLLRGAAPGQSDSAGLLRGAVPGLFQPGDSARPGIMLYGGAAGSAAAATAQLLPAMTLRSALIGVQEIVAGDTVGYGGHFRAQAPMRVGVVACGYADGYPRHAPTGTPVLVDGVATRPIGRVSMDMMTVDLGPVPGARVGSGVTLWGQGLPIDTVAQAACTIGYELMCALAARVAVDEDEC